MAQLLLLVSTEADGSLARPALEALSAALSLVETLGSTPLTLGMVGETIEPAARHVAGCGATRFLGATGPDLAQPRYATDAAAAEAIARASQADLILAPATSRWNRVLPGVAHRLGGRVDTHVTQLAATDGAPSITRWYYRQRLEAVLRRSHRPWIILVEPGTHPVWTGNPGVAQVEPVAVPLTDAHRRTSVLGLRQPPGDAQTIRPDAELLFVTGAGWTKKQADGQVHVTEAESIIRTFLDCTRASLGSSKSLVDLGGEGQAVLPFLTHLNQIGQTGATPRHPKGLATCCHGEEPHTVGWRFVNDRRAINLDANCGWARGKADVLYVADAFAVMRQVNELLTRQG
jgi:electron transfer flavoprotein alpha subunit